MAIDSTETLGLTKMDQTDNGEKQQEKLRYGFKTFRPDCLQIFNKPIAFLLVACFVVFGHGFSATGLNNTAYTSIEKRYGLTSTQISMFPFCQHITAGLLCLITCYFGHRHRPAMIAFGCCITSIGFLIISIPQYIVPAYKAGVVLLTDTCRLNSTTNATSHCKMAKVDDSDVSVFPIFLLGYALLGIGISPLYSLAYAHIDEITSRKKSYIYLAIISIVGILGPSAGFMAASPILRIFVDIEQPANSNLKPIDRNWVGAWWLAFVIGSIIMFIPIIPLIGFPNKFSDTERKLKEKRKFKDTVQIDQNLTNDFKSMVPALISLLKNKPYLFLSISLSLEFIVISGFATFLPKHLESQFHLTAPKAASASGFIMLPGSIIGISLGAFICRKYSLNGRQLLIFNAVTFLLNTIAFTGILLGCEGRDVVGVTSSYLNSTQAGNETVLDLQNICNEHCHCSSQLYKPVCSVHDQKTYYSPCHAGCSAEYLKNNHYTNCTCLGSPSLKVMRGRCSPPCRSYPIFMVLFFIATCISFMTKVPIIQATFRLVPEGQGSLAQGLQQFLARFIGFIPAAPLFGSMIDKSCKLWHTDVCSGKTTSCLEYDNEKFRFYLWLLSAVVKLIGLFFMLIALKCYRLPEKQKVEKLLQEDEMTTINLKD